MQTWPTVPLGEVLDYRKDFVLIDDLLTYRRPRVQLHAQGIVLRDEVPGALIKTKKQQVVRAGDFLVAEIDAKVGGFGIVPDNLDGAIVSSHYFLYEYRPRLLDNRFLGWFVKTPAFRQQVEAQRQEDFVYPKLMAWEGALTVVPPECHGLVVSTEFPVFEIDQSRICPEVFDVHFRSPEVWPNLSGKSGGTNVRRRRLNPEEFLNLEIPVPSAETQRKLVRVMAKLRSARDLQMQTSRELAAMLPAVLDQAFKGHLQ